MNNTYVDWNDTGVALIPFLLLSPCDGTSILRADQPTYSSKFVCLSLSKAVWPRPHVAMPETCLIATPCSKVSTGMGYIYIRLL